MGKGNFEREKNPYLSSLYQNHLKLLADTEDTFWYLRTIVGIMRKSLLWVPVQKTHVVCEK